MKNKILISAIALSAAFSMLTGCSTPGEDDPIYVKVGDFGVQEFTDAVNVSGTIENGNATPYVISTNLESYGIKKLNVKVGDYVQAGDVICEFDTENIQKQIAEKESKINSNAELDSKTIDDLKTQLSGEEELQRLKLNRINENRDANQQKYDEAKRKYDEALNRFNQANDSYNDAENNLRNASTDAEISQYYGLCSNYQAQISQYSSEMSQYKSTMDSAQDAISSADYEYGLTKMETDKSISDLKYRIDSYRTESETKEELKKLQEQLENSVIRAEHDGIVEKVNVSEGQISSEKNLVSIIDNDNKIVHVILNDNDMLSVKEGMKATLTTSSGTIGTIEGTVSKINKVKGEQGFDVYIQCDDLDSLYIGMNVSIGIIVFSDKVDAVPKKAVQSEEDSDAKFVYVAVPAGDGSFTVEKRNVKIGLENPEYSQILDGELKSGEKVVISSNAALSEGLNVTISDES